MAFRVLKEPLREIQCLLRLRASIAALWTISLRTRFRAEAYRSLQEAGDELLALHRLNVPNTLHRSLLSTNGIENSFLNTRRKLGRVTRFRAETEQASRWLSYALLEAERGVRKIVGHDLLPSLITALGRPPIPSS